MTAYLDTSLLVSALSREPMTVQAQAWLVRQGARSMLVSDWTVTEVSSALAMKLRTGQVTPTERANILAEFRRLVRSSFEVLPVSSSHFRQAASFADHHNLGLRSGDALHLAISASQGAVLHTLDRRLAAAGPPLGVATELLA